MISLQAQNLTIIRSARQIFEPVDFSLSQGELLLLKGQNGAGKSTLLRMLAGYLPNQAGQIIFSDHSDGRQEGIPTEYIHYLGHKDPIKPALSVREQLSFWKKFLLEVPEFSKKTQQYKRPYDALEAVDLKHVLDVPGGYLSQGQRRRVSIARMILCPRPLWLLDEPTAGLDQASEIIFGHLLQDHLTAGGIVIAATHLDLPLKGQKEITLKMPALHHGFLEER